MEPATVVIFRKWKDSGEVFALFPELPADFYGVYCDSYVHTGQHGSAEYHSCIERSKYCTREEYRQLFDELSLIGYTLTVVCRATQEHHKKRREAAHTIQSTTVY